MSAQDSVTIYEIKALEDLRYRAMLAGDSLTGNPVTPLC
jgi:hypothetical protein